MSGSALAMTLAMFVLSLSFFLLPFTSETWTCLNLRHTSANGSRSSSARWAVILESTRLLARTS